MRALASFVLAAATLTAAGTARADYMGPTHDGPDTVYETPQKAISNVIYINRCVGGCTITKGPRNNSTTDTSWFPVGADGQTYQLTEFSHDDATFNAVVACVQDVYLPYNVVVTTTDPGTAPHTEVYAAGLDTEIGINGAGGLGGAVSQNISIDSACSGGENGVAFAFLNGYPASQTELMCAVIAQETGHSLGLLDHERECTDPMSASYYGPCNNTDRSYFRNRLMKCGDAADGPCVCGGNFVNSHTHLRGIFGDSGNAQPAPTASIISPTEGATISGSTIFGITGDGGNRGTFKAQVFLNGWPWGTWDAPDHLAPGTWPPENITISLDSGLPDGDYDAFVRVYDDLGTSSDTPTIHLHKGSPCTSADTCADGQKCEDGKCFWDSPTGQLGDACEVDQQCEGPNTYDGQCQSDGSQSLCTRDCSGGALDDCDEGFSCLITNDTEQTGVCWPDSEGGCCSVGHEDSRAVMGMLGLAFAVGAVLSRRRRSR
jgi:MYXO-CTERM domain-containing protein